jgi:hypothetical protein
MHFFVFRMPRKEFLSMSLFSGNLSRPWLFFVAVIVTVAAIDFPLVLARYGFGDDFVIFFSTTDQAGAYSADGRAVFALAQTLLHRHVRDLEQLAYFRAASILGVAVLASLIGQWLRRWRWTSATRWFVSVAIATLPCLQTYAAQAVIWLSPWAGVLVVLSAGQSWRFIRNHREPVPHRFLRATIAMLAMGMAALVYQPMLSYYWVVGLILLLDRRFRVSAAHRSATVKFVLFGVLAMFLSLVVMKASFLLTGATPKDRIAMIDDPITKIYAFARVQWPQAASAWWLMPVPSHVFRAFIGVVIAVMIAANAFVWSGGSRRLTISLTTLIGLAFFIAASHAHWWVIADVPQSYRIISALGVSAFLATLHTLASFIQRRGLLPQRWFDTRLLRCWPILGVLVVAAVTVALNRTFWIATQEHQLGALVTRLQNEVRPTTNHLHLIRQEFANWPANRSLIECYGRPAFDRPWAIDYIARVALKRSGVEHQINTISHGDATDPIPRGNEVVVIDTRQIGPSEER